MSVLFQKHVFLVNNEMFLHRFHIFLLSMTLHFAENIEITIITVMFGDIISLVNILIHLHGL